MGGLHVVPDVALRDVVAADVELLMIPGGELWHDETYDRNGLEKLIATLVADGTPIAAICAGTIALAGALAARDGHVVTASGLGAVDFARATFEELDLFAERERDTWFELFKRGKLPAPRQ